MWKIRDNRTGAYIEHHNSPRHAQHALMILTAHELKNGRVPDYTVTPRLMEPLTLAELQLPSWALTELKKVGLT